jgi:hypothetical protein
MLRGEGEGRRVEHPHARRSTESSWNQVGWPFPPDEIRLGQEPLFTANMILTGTFILERPATVSIPADPGKRRKTGGPDGSHSNFLSLDAWVPGVGLGAGP